MAKKVVTGTAVCGAVGLLFLVAGCVLIPVFKTMIDDGIKEGILLKNGSDTYHDWVFPPMEIYFQIWVFDVVNPNEVIHEGARPLLEEKGPYSYREYRQKVNLTFHDNCNTVSYRENHWYVFDRSKSVGPETDTFTTVNIPMVTIANLIRYEYSWLQKFVNLALELTGEHLFTTLSVGDILWGYEDPLAKAINDIIKDFNTSFQIDGHFGLFYNQNASNDGLYRIFTGVGDVTELANILSWNENSTLSFWTTPEANMINGTDATLFPPSVDKSDTLYVFSSDICRSLYLDYVQEYEFHGIDLYNFVIPDSLFANNTNNQGFCTPFGNCLPSGVLNVSNCRQGAPVIMSQPHFLNADPVFLHHVDGLHPNQEYHQTYIGVEPMTGIAMNIAERLQINIFLEKVSYITETEKIRPVVLPVLWLNESAVLEDKEINKFKTKVLQPIKLTQAVQFGSIALGAFIIVCCLAFAVKILTTRKKREKFGAVNEESAKLLN